MSPPKSWAPCFGSRHNKDVVSFAEMNFGWGPMVGSRHGFQPALSSLATEF